MFVCGIDLKNKSVYVLKLEVKAEMKGVAELQPIGCP